MSTVTARWSVEQVIAIAPSPRALAAAEPLADATRWVGLGCDERAVWGRCRGSGREPYETAVDHQQVAWRCSCPSRVAPCKHALALLLLWVRDGVPAAARPEGVTTWIAARDRRAGRDLGGSSPADSMPAGESDPPDGEPPAAPDRDALDRARDERVARMHAGLAELDRWLTDRLRTGLSEPSLARYATWDALAARLVDAQAGSLANRVRRLAGMVGTSPEWHSDVLAEIGMLHLIAQAGQRLGDLPGTLADVAATAAGWQVRQVEVLAGVPETDEWVVLGRSDRREDRIEVRRVWLRGAVSGRTAMLLSFAAYRQALDDTWRVGTVVAADLHRYPGASLRALAGARHGEPRVDHAAAAAMAMTIAAACNEIGAHVTAEPWLERMAVTVRAVPTTSDGRWVLTDATGSLPIAGGADAIATLLAAAGGQEVVVSVEWTPRGLLPLTVHLADRAIDVGPRADPSFVGAA